MEDAESSGKRWEEAVVNAIREAAYDLYKRAGYQSWENLLAQAWAAPETLTADQQNLLKADEERTRAAPYKVRGPCVP